MIAYLIVIVVIASRFIPHLPNLVPITAIAIFAAVYLPTRQAVAIPLLARFVSDLFIGFFAWPLMIAVYASHIFGVLLGLWIKKQTTAKKRWTRIALSGFISAGVFFVVTNLVVFYPEMYLQTFVGQIVSYTNALPFLRGTVLADVGYTLALFGTVEAFGYIRSRLHNRKTATIIA